MAVEATKEDLRLESTSDTLEEVQAAVGVTPKEAPPEEPPKETIKPEPEESIEEAPGKAAKVEDETPPEESGTSEEEPEAPERPKESKANKRIRQLNKRTHEAEARADRAEAALAAKGEVEEPEVQPAVTAPGDKPSQDNFETFEEFNEALMDWKIEEKAKAIAVTTRQTRVAEKWKSGSDVARGKHGDFDVTIEESAFTVTEAMQEAMVDSGIGPEVLYHLAKNPAEAERIAALGPLATIRAVGRIEAVLEGTPVSVVSENPKPKLPGAPPPIEPVSGTSVESTKHPDGGEMSHDEYKAWLKRNYPSHA